MKRYSCLLFILLIFSCKSVLHLADAKDAAYTIKASENLEADTAISNLIAPYKNQLDERINEVIGSSAITMILDKPQSTLGNWMADLLHQKSEDYYGAPIDFAIVNYGGVRISELPAGPVTLGKIYELMPFENRMVVLKANGTIVQQLFEKMAGNGGWPISRQVRYSILKNAAKDSSIHGAPLDPKKIYKIAMADFIANGGDKCFFLKDQPRDELNILVRDMIIEFVQEEAAQGKYLDAEMDHRVRLFKE